MNSHKRNIDILLHIIQYCNVAHQYGQIDIELLWNTSNERIPELKKYCKGILEKHALLEQQANDIEPEE